MPNGSVATTAVPAPAKAAAKPAAKTRSKTVAPTPQKTAAKPTAPAASAPAAKPAAKSAAKPAVKAKAPAKPVAEKPVKVKKPKMVRDSLTIPKPEYAVLDILKLRAAKLASPAKKTELIRAGIKAIAAMTDEAFLAAIKAVPSLKTGRPASKKSS
ncbi:MAG: hypothetical protein A3F78_12480 [Burkholderiales bacterium RIFCSPLOWO2_12_FULL_61_40]|nr:MAG: hypothetical protein A3F78_12480 [Burkholderiales bacterium RIFCSPLOWO2_12_FULL_61_40]